MPHPRSQETDQYLSRVESSDAKASLTRLREIVHETFPEVQEVFSYGLPGFKFEGGPLIWFGAFRSIVRFLVPYPTPSLTMNSEPTSYRRGPFSFLPIDCFRNP